MQFMQLANVTNRPNKVIGIHFLPPVHLKDAVEVVFARKTTGESTATVFSILKQIKKVCEYSPDISKLFAFTDCNFGEKW
jgi:3-hydroxyacyl-CoA dehydrogenase